VRATVFAPATAPGRAAIAVLRISGPRAHEALRALGAEVPPDRRLRLRRLRHPQTGEALDEALVATFPERASYTGEAAAELHLHGGMAPQRAVLRALGGLPGLRLAEPGEFTRRAFENGRLDLARAEGVAALIEAETEAQRRQALRLYEGELSQKLNAWRAALAEARALLEADVEFADEIGAGDVAAEGRRALSTLSNELREELARAQAARRVREGVEIALVGPPNVGKSSLFNALVRREAAITSPIAGTTRDAVEARLDLSGRLAILVDLAGLREAADPLERLGVERARARAAEADVRVFVGDGVHTVDPAEARLGDVKVINKIDLRPAAPEGWIGVSARTGAGLGSLVEALDRAVADAAGAGGLVAAERHRAAIEAAVQWLERAAAEASVELAAEGARHAARVLGAVLGEADIEKVLDAVFSRFCIGK
jgi:tRNA modification GTPase